MTIVTVLKIRKSAGARSGAPSLLSPPSTRSPLAAPGGGPAGRALGGRPEPRWPRPRQAHWRASGRGHRRPPAGSGQGLKSNSDDDDRYLATCLSGALKVDLRPRSLSLGAGRGGRGPPPHAAQKRRTVTVTTVRPAVSDGGCAPRFPAGGEALLGINDSC